MDAIEIPLSKSKLLLAVGGCILFVMLGIYLLTEDVFQHINFPPAIAKGAGILSIVFFGVVGFLTVRKMFDNKTGLRIDETGITDNTSANSIGLIPWSEISAIKTGQVMSTKFLLIHTKNPDQILEKVSHVKRRMMQANQKMYGTPFAITSTTLKYNFSQLESLLQNKLNEYKTR